MKRCLIWCGLEEFAQRAVVPVDEGVVGEQPLRLDPELGEVGEAALDEGRDGVGAFVACSSL